MVMELAMVRTIVGSSSSLELLMVVDTIGDKALSVETSSSIKLDHVEATMAITIREVGMALIELKALGDRISVLRTLSLNAVKAVVQVATMAAGVQFCFRDSKIKGFGKIPTPMVLILEVSLVSSMKGVEEDRPTMPMAIT